ncbi:MAG: 30S ribosomal protein S21 [Parcubacteria group bacterium]|nr:30S ribosomal protein S21 [Parcubacteria group bacterium]
MINAEVSKAGNENALSLLRKFSRRVQGTGLMRRMRAERYHSRPTSKTTKKKQALSRLVKRAKVQQLIKEGKMAETPVRNGAAKKAQ